MPQWLGPGELLVVLLIVFLLFGFKKLPDAARSLGKSARVFKSEVNEMKEEDRAREEAKRARGTDAVPGSTTGTTPVRDDVTHRDGDAVIDEAKPRTDNQSGPVA